ncbi:MAG: TIGR04076 family protein [Candidatus Hodarchaeota archaeon]
MSYDLGQINGDFMAEKSKVKITVLKRLNTRDVFGDSPPPDQFSEACSAFEEGQEFIVGDEGGMPEGFCYWAWNDLFTVVAMLRYGAGVSKKGKETPKVRCCTDGLRPVVFSIERI